jgi:hypothetical protein
MGKFIISKWAFFILLKIPTFKLKMDLKLETIGNEKCPISLWGSNPGRPRLKFAYLAS